MSVYMQPIFFNKAGNLLLERYVCGKPSRKPGDAVFHHGAVVSITPTVTTNTQALPDGNSDWPAAQPVTGREGTVAVELSFMSPELYAFLMGTTIEKLKDTVMTVVDFEAVIPEADEENNIEASVKLEHEPLEGTLLVVDYEGKHFTLAEGSTPGEGEYVVDSEDEDTLIFNEGDAGKAVYVTYDWTADEAVSFGFPKSGTPFAFRATVSGEAMSDDEFTLYDVNIIVDRAKATGTINPPPMSKSPTPQTITLQVLRPRGGKAVDFRFVKGEDSECVDDTENAVEVIS